ncbi:aminoglycoside O-phosphotransferase APH(3')-IIIa [Macrococcus epidermidis]|uniref:Aminoglycoside O-phosphotransferase APH(3')-IIIa n=1 Tax=Macrococcus epidermidis TaxID=1902580 RepID=A0A327ZSV4_9STAP|nr:APH(3') family aminoglycoside O-phosphotransferase [Macrococcus epidermidis]RAK44604.1 aminoglycoside O-phosphotransferase APH(3')-IIIa [Macrococcus epidermidis]
MKIGSIAIPNKIAEYIKNQSYKIDNIGRSHSSVIIFEDYVLKIEPISLESKNEIKLMKWLKGRLPVPVIIAHCENNDTSYLLMSRLNGEMLYEVNNSLELYAKAINELKEIDFRNCPVDNRLQHYIKKAEYNVENGFVDIEDANPDTYGPEAFKDPQELLTWLKDNQPDEEISYTHGDLCMPNILVNNGKVSGYIDLGRGGLGDPYRDIALCYRSYLYNTDINEEELKNELERLLGFKLDMQKIRYYILIDELF